MERASYIEQFDHEALHLGVAIDSHRTGWASLAHDLRHLATMAQEAASIEARERALEQLNMEEA